MAKKEDKTLKIVGLLLNVLVLPGLGTLVGGGKERINIGIVQLVLTVVSFPLMFVLVGFPLAFAMWVWGLVVGIQMVNE